MSTIENIIQQQKLNVFLIVQANSINDVIHINYVTMIK